MSNEVAVVASSRLSSLEATPPMHVDRDRSAPGIRNTWRHPTHWFLLLLLPETQTVFDVTEKLMFSARGLCLSSPKAGRSQGPPVSSKVVGEVTENKSMSARNLGRKELLCKEKQDSVSGVQSEVCGLGKGWTEWAETIGGFP